MDGARRALLTGLTIGLASAAAPALAAPAFVMDSITLYLPQQFYAERVGGSIEPMAAHINRLKAKAADVFAAAPTGPGVSGTLVMMVKPGQRARVWIVTGEPLPEPLVTQLKAELEAVTPMKVKKGPLLYGIAFSAWSGGARPPYFPMAFPAEWSALVPEGGAIDDDFMAKIWPN